MTRGETTTAPDDCPDLIDDVFAEAARVLVLGNAYCEGLPWSALDAADRAEWLPRGRRLRRAMEERGATVAVEDDRH